MPVFLRIDSWHYTKQEQTDAIRLPRAVPKMIMVPAFFLGALIGAMRAYKKQGSRLDMLQYGAVYGIIFFIIGLFATIAIGWLGWV